MKTDDLENNLRNLKFSHLPASELAAYCEGELAPARRALVEAHLKQCFICARQVEQIREENEALESRVTSPEDVAFVEQLIKQAGPTQTLPEARPLAPLERISLQERLTEYLRPMMASLRFYLRPVRGVENKKGESVWEWQSEDAKLQAYATIEENADLIVHFSSNDPGLEGARLHVRARELDQEITLRRISELEIYAQVVIPWPLRRGRIADTLSIEFVQGD